MSPLTKGSPEAIVRAESAGVMVEGNIRRVQVQEDDEDGDRLQMTEHNVLRGYSEGQITKAKISKT